MSKNTTRKGFALGATFALVASGFTAAPAFAADSLVTSLASGTSFNSVVGYANELKLSTVMSPGIGNNDATLHYRISNPSGAVLEIGVANTTSSTVAIATTNQANDTAGIWSVAGAAYSTVDSDGDQASQQTALTDFVVVPLGAKDGAVADENFITIGVKDGDKNVTVTVTAWLDTAANASNVQDTVEITGNTVTLNFYDQANITATSTLIAPVTGASSVQAEITTNPELNGQQLGADFIDVAWTAQGNANAVLAEMTSSDAAASPTMGGTTYSGTSKKWTSTAYLAYSKASDAWNGTNGTLDSLADLTDNNGAAAGTTPVKIAIASNVATFSLFPHGLGASNTGTFKVRFVGLNSATINSATAAFQTLTIVDANGFTIPLTDGDQAAENASAGSAAFWSVGTHSTVQASGVYSARPYIGTTALSAAASSATTSSVTADDTEAVIVASANVEEGYDDDASSTGNAATDDDYVVIRKGTTSVTVTATVYYTDALDFNKIKTVPAGVPVVGSITVGTGTFQINSSGAGVTSDTELTNANGEVTFTVTTTTAAASDNVTIDIRPQATAAANAAGAKFDLRWQDAAFTLYDLNTVQDQPDSNASSYRHINTGGTYGYSFALLDQWGQAAPADTWRLQVVNSGRTVSSDTHVLSNGRVSVNVADGAQGAGSTITSTVNVQKLVSGTWTTQAGESWDGTGFGTVIINVAAAESETITLDADAGTSYQSTYNAQTADLADAVAAATTTAQNRRLSAVLKPAYTNDVVLNGRVTAALTGLAKGGTNVTVSGNSSILFSYGKVESFGSIVVPADAAGDFTVNLYSNKAFDDTVITLTTANGASKTVKVDFGPATARSGRTLTLTSSTAEPGKTMIVTGLLTDKWGNPVDTDQTDTNAAGASTLDAGDARLTVTYSGPGLISGSLPVETGADGTFTVRVLLGSNDTGTATVSATYGAANGTISAADTGLNIDVKSALTVTIGKAVSTTGKVNVGSFNGKLVVYASNLNGARISWKVGGNWGSQVAASNYAIFNRPTPRAGVTVSVDIYVNGVKTLTKSVVTR